MFRASRQQLQLASEALGWHGTCVGPIRQMGTQIWPVIALTDGGGSQLGPATARGQGREPGGVELVGCLLVGEASTQLVDVASLFAGYSSRAIVVPGDAPVPLEVMVEAAVLDQGVVAVHSESCVVLSAAGPRVARVSGLSPGSENHQSNVDEDHHPASASRGASASRLAEHAAGVESELKTQSLAALRSLR